MPRSLGVTGGAPGKSFVYVAFAQFYIAFLAILPPLPYETPLAVSCPLFQALHIGLHFSIAKIAYPSCQVGVHLVDNLLKSELFKLDPNGSNIGRSFNNHLSIKGNMLVSRQHASIKKVGDNWIVADLNSRYGTMVNGKRVSEPQSLSSHDEVWFSSAVIHFVIA